MKITNEIRLFVYSRTNFKCGYCGVNFTFDPKLKKKIKPNIDHIIPTSKNGSNDIGNLMACCYSCNSTKKSMDLDCFRKKMKHPLFTEKQIDFIEKNIDKDFNNKLKNIEKVKFYFEEIGLEINPNKRSNS